MSELNLPLLTPVFWQNPNTGRPLANGSLKLHLAGTDSEKAAFFDRRGENAAPNPYNLGSSGLALLYLNGAYRVEAYDGPDGTGSLVMEIDYLNSISVELETGNPGALISNNNLSDLSDVAAARSVLGLTFQTSTTDGSDGRVLRNGAWGIGGVNGGTIPSDNPDLITRSGVYRTNNLTTNLPTGVSYGALLHISGATDRYVQIVAETTGTAEKSLWWRERSGAGWSVWYQIWHSANSFTLGATQATARDALGLDAQDPPGDDVDQIVLDGSYGVTSTTANLPVAFAGVVEHRNRSASGIRAAQVYRSAANDAKAREFWRELSGDGWSSWYESLHTANTLILGTTAAAARTTLDVLPAGTGGSSARTNTENDARFLRQSQNLGDLASASTARSNLGLGSAATQADTRYHRSGTDTLDAGDLPTTAAAESWVQDRLIDIDYNDLGTIAFLSSEGSTELNPNVPVSGASLKYAAIRDDGSDCQVVTANDAVPGTWRAHGGSDGADGGNRHAAIFRRLT